MVEKGIIYCLTSPSNKKYIGQTTRKIDKRISEHGNRPECKAIHGAILKYGIEKFELEILYEGPCDEITLDKMETDYIKKYNTLCPNGYNIRTGGSNGKHCEASRERMRIAKLGPKNPNYGKPRTPETRAKISESRSGEKHHYYGKTLSDEHKLKLSKAHKKDSGLPMYVVRIKARPKHYCSAGYAVVNHSKLKNKYFTSKKLTEDEKLKMAMNYLNSA